MNQTKTAKPVLSVLDIILLLFSALIVMSAVYLHAEERKAAPAPDTATYDAAFYVELEFKEYVGIWQPGQRVFDADGKEIGKILTAAYDRAESGLPCVTLGCELYGVCPTEGEDFWLNTRMLQSPATVLVTARRAPTGEAK